MEVKYYVLTAKTASGKKVSLMTYPKEKIEKLREHEQFFCPDCGERVIVRAGPKTTPHFAHQRHSACSLLEGGESAYHEAGKIALYHWLLRQRIDCDVEKYLSKTKQRADVYATINGRAFALEFQCTKISLRQIKTRHARYLSTQTTPIWILDERLLRTYTATTLHVNTFMLSFLHYLKHNQGVFLYFLCPNKERLTIVQDIILTSQRRAIAHIRSYHLQTLSFKTLFSRKTVTNEQIATVWHNEKKRLRLSRMNYAGKELKWRNWLYERKFFIETLPSIIHMPTRYNFIFSVPPWIWQSVCIIHLLDRLQIGARFSLLNVYNVVKRYVSTVVNQQKVNPPIVYDALHAYFSLLVREKFIRKISENTYEKIAEIPQYHNVEEALHGDAELLNRFMYNHNVRDV